MFSKERDVCLSLNLIAQLKDTSDWEITVCQLFYQSNLILLCRKQASRKERILNFQVVGTVLKLVWESK